MQTAEIDALVHAHKGHARAVAFLHVLRQTKLEEADHAFLQRYAAELTAADLLRWRARTEPSLRAPILVAFAKMAETFPAQFEHEVMNAPGLSFDDREWQTLADLLRDKIAPALYVRVVRRDIGPRATPPQAPFSPDDRASVDLTAMFGFDEGDKPAPAPGDGDVSLFGAGSLDDALGLDFGSDDSAPLFADPFAGLSVEAGYDKLKKSPSGDERAMLLDWLEGRGFDKDKLLTAAFVTLADATIPVSSHVVAWVTKRLASKEGFASHGASLFDALVGRRAFAELQEVLAQGSALADSDASMPHAALSSVLLEQARLSLRTKDEARALAMLAALSCLDVNDDVRKRFGPLKQAAKKEGAGSSVIALVDLLVRLARGPGKPKVKSKGAPPRSAPLESMIASVHALSDALGESPRMIA